MYVRDPVPDAIHRGAATWHRGERGPVWIHASRIGQGSTPSFEKADLVWAHASSVGREVYPLAFGCSGALRKFARSYFYAYTQLQSITSIIIRVTSGITIIVSSLHRGRAPEPLCAAHCLYTVLVLEPHVKDVLSWSIRDYQMIRAQQYVERYLVIHLNARVSTRGSMQAQ